MGIDQLVAGGLNSPRYWNAGAVKREQPSANYILFPDGYSQAGISTSYFFIPVVATPSMKYLWANRNTRTVGMITSVVPARTSGGEAW